MNYLVGDLQGCAQALEQLLTRIDFSPSRDRIVVLGDLVNRGPASRAVLQRLTGLGDSATCLLGNHDLHLLAVAQGVRALHRNDTFADVLEAPEREAMLDWLRHRPLAHTECGWLCVHAGVVPLWDTAMTMALAAEVQQQLRGTDWASLLQQMYGSQPARWDAQLAGIDRWRFVINVLTRIRFCTEDGTLDFAAKEGVQAAPPGHKPWFDHAMRRSAGQPIAFGHWSTLGLINRPELMAMDTGCVWGGALSAVRVDGGRRELLQIPCAQAQRPGRLESGA